MRTLFVRRIVQQLALVFLLLSLSGQSAWAISLIDTSAGIMDTHHWQVLTPGGDQSHLIQIVTSFDQLDSAIDADVVLADGAPLVMTWKTDQTDAAPLVMTWKTDQTDAASIDLALALAIDSEPCHLEISLRRPEGPVPTFSQVDYVSSSGVPVITSPNRVVIYFDEPIGALQDCWLGNSDQTPGGSPMIPWRIDISALSPEDTFDIVLRAGPEGDFDDNDIVDLVDYEEFSNCIDSEEPEDTCIRFFDFEADGDIDLRDFAIFQNLFTGTTIPAACGV